MILEYLGRWSRVFRGGAGDFNEDFRRAFLAQAQPLIDQLSHPQKGAAL